jgi:hypothetical protein
MESPTTIWSKFTLFSEAASQAVSQVIGSLVFDSNLRLTPMAVRRSSPLKSRRMVYQANLLTICLEMQDGGDGRTTIIGQIMPGDRVSLDGVELWVERGNQPVAIGAASYSGDFRLAGIRPATYTLILRTVPVPSETAPHSTRGEIILGPITVGVGQRA